jgi:NADH:ubiquinone oxidoreductase subunit K
MLTPSPINSVSNHVLFDWAVDPAFTVGLAVRSADALPTWLVFALFLYLAGLLGIVFNFKNFLVTMMAIELMYLGAVSSFVLYGTACHDPRGSIYGLLLLIVAASESAIGLGILIVLYRFGRTIDFKAYQQLGG